MKIKSVYLNSFILLVSILTSNTSTYTQINIDKELNQIQITPKIKGGTVLKYSVKRYKLIPSETEEATIDSMTYQMNLKFTSVANSILNFNISYAGIADTMMNYLHNGVHAEIAYDMATKNYEVKNDSAIIKTMQTRIGHLKDNENLDSLMYKNLDNYLSKVSSTKSIKKMYKELKYILSPYENIYAYNQFKADTTQSKDMLGNPAKRIKRQGIFKIKGTYVFQYRRNLIPTSSIEDALASKIEEDLGQGAKLLSIDSNISENKQESYKYIDIVFDKKSGIIQSNVYEEKKSIFGIVAESKRVFTLIK